MEYVTRSVYFKVKESSILQILVSVCAILAAPKNKYSSPPLNSIKS